MKIKKKKKSKNCLFKDSNIIRIDEKELISNWFEKKTVKMIKLLDSKNGGDSIRTFASKCAQKYPTIVIVKTTKGFRFGGFTSKSWANGNYTKDNKCFLFSLDKKEKYNITDDNNVTYLDSYRCFLFGDVALLISNNCTSNKNNYLDISSFTTVSQNYDINDDEQNFTVSSYEVYQIEY